jgi:hypothetical protein
MTDDDLHNGAAYLLERLQGAVDYHAGENDHMACLVDDLADLVGRMRHERSALTRRVMDVLLTSHRAARADELRSILEHATRDGLDGGSFYVLGSVIQERLKRLEGGDER